MSTLAEADATFSALEVDPEILTMSAEEVQSRTRMLDREVQIMETDANRLRFELERMKAQLEDNVAKVKRNKALPYLVSTVVELLDVDPEEMEEEDGANQDLDSQRKGKCAVIKTSTRQTVFLPIAGLVPPAEMRPGDLVGVNKDSYLILEKLPAEYDSRVKAMELDEAPSETLADVGGLNTQIDEMREAVVWPFHEDKKAKFLALGIQPPKGVLFYGPPGTGKTLLAKACANMANAAFLKLAGPQLVQMFIGDGAKLVRDAFALAKEKAPTIIFIDELDAVGMKRQDSELSGDREVQRTMLELLNQMDGFSAADDIKVIAATNRIDILDPALLRSGRFDRKIEFPHPDAQARASILQIHSRKMNVRGDVNYDELSRSTEGFNSAQLKAVAVEAGMLALRREGTEIVHEDFVEAIAVVQARKKAELEYYA
ncbi:26S protease regulatory subunit 6A [Thecamonas trahens ATCC 50062]|uniref:26S protease regulatory subunit 6A n=1 Tax=Thecamonas trahens ATCC 50062 TaxID=461836 RepID=A0A0L0DDE8_THETB|nr:26S protease regulatory subunit 6A [Thecamonas trahens ATCC 50062]KNC50245.1 26S protease regulatory subunit 6A [Thecamonas trahens ATCC 50062]|eukprot:XP_013757075.1 26S protease regulatory subunit 6A [Thecamonas trahens ATCC 50062]